MKIKDTLNLGKTAFPMRAGLPNKEPKMQEAWDEAILYENRLKENAGKPSFILHDGPPYANGDIHVGHALNKISKDMIMRYKNMAGFRAPYVPGWDTHGLPIEQVLTKKGIKRKELDRAAYLRMCQEYALTQVDLQRKGFKSLGVLGDWENPYITLNPEFEAAQIRVFGHHHQRVLLLKQKSSIKMFALRLSILLSKQLILKDYCQMIQSLSSGRQHRGKFHPTKVSLHILIMTMF